MKNLYLFILTSISLVQGMEENQNFSPSSAYKQVNLENGLGHFRVVPTEILTLIFSGFPDRLKLRELSKAMNSVISHNIHFLGVKQSKFDNNSLQNLLQNSPHLKKLKIFHEEGMNDVSYIARLSELTGLVLSYWPNLFYVGLNHLSKCLRLTELSLEWGQLKDDSTTDAGISHILSCTNLTNLNLCWCGVTDVGISQLSQLAHLSTLDVSSNKEITPLGLTHLSIHTNLTRLNLAGCKMGDEISYLTSLTKLSILNLQKCPGLKNHHIAQFSTHTNLTDLNLDFNGELKDGCIDHILKLTSLTSLSLYYCFRISRASLLKLYKLMPNLKSLNFGIKIIN